ncbi:hypothetical protein EBZ80_00210 [bacterium]|nr:hypothetical protein [bacterium]
MRKTSFLTKVSVFSIAIPVAVFAVTAGCKTRSQVASEKAIRVHPVLGSLRASCAGGSCHGVVSKAILTRWQKSTKVVYDCLRTNGAKEESLLAGGNADKLAECLEDFPQGAGLFRTYYQSKDFEGLLRKAKRSDDDIGYLQSMVMPNPQSATQAQLAYASDEAKLWQNILWFASEDAVTAIDKLPEESVNAKTCKSDRISRSLVSHVTEKSSNPFANWWSRKNLENQLAMFACPDQRRGAYNPEADCFKGASNVTGIAAPQPGGEGEAPFRIVALRELPANTYYWMRVSPDGRFVGNGSSEDMDPEGNGFEAFVDDLAAANRRVIVRAKYDPGFTPDNEWFLFQGANGDHAQAAFCRMSVLSRMNKIEPMPPACLGPTERDGSHIHLYQSIGADPEGGPYVIAQGGWENDNGGNSASGGRLVFNADPIVKQGKNNLNVFVFDGAGSGLADSLVFNNEGDWVVSPTTRLVVGRYGQGSSEQHGYRIHMLNVQPDTGKKAGFSVSHKVVGEICNVDPATRKPQFRGGKVQISLDDRFLATHRYTGTEEASLEKASSDIMLYDTLTGNSMQVTNMPTGMYALYPSWRSDGWIYFLVRDRRTNAGKDFVAATNAAWWLSRQPGSNTNIVDDNEFEGGE